VVWYYTFGVNCTKKFNRSHAHLFHFVKDSKRFTFNDKPIRVPSARQLVYADGRAHPSGRLPDDTWILRPQDVPHGFEAKQDTWYFPRVAGTFKERAGFHGCQMPEQLLGRIIRSCSNPGDLVLDPFTGSGTTLAVANKLGRRWLGYELSESYARKALDRIQKTCPGQLLEGAPEPVVSAPRTPRSEKRPGANRVNDSEMSLAAPVSLVHGVGTATQRGDVERAIIAAFLAANCGFSTDRVVADPELNANFLHQCRKLGIPGEPTAWNWTLMKLRKAAKLARLPAARRTSFPREELDSYSFASEIAIRKMLNDGSPSVDHILCDPKQAETFDGYAREFAPNFSPLQYRWAALQIRKRALDIRRQQVDLPREILNRRVRRFQPINEVALTRVHGQPGAYLLRTASDHPLYAGETLDLGARISRKLEAFGPWRRISKEIHIGIVPFDLGERGYQQGFQSNWIKEREPELNYRGLGVA